MYLDVAPTLNGYLIEQLKKASILGTTVKVSEFNRGIGKSTALVGFAREFDFTVIVSNKHDVNRLKDSTGYPKIISQRDIGSQTIDSKFVHDEGIEESVLKGLNVITGFRKVY